MCRSSLSRVLAVPLEVLLLRVRNLREAELISDISRLASTFDMLLSKYETLAVQTQNLQKAWDASWLAQEPYVLAAVPLVGEKMSGVNRARTMLLKRMDAELQNLQAKASALLHFIDVNASIAEELKMEGIMNLAADKLLLVSVEEELVQRIKNVCIGLSLRKYSSMSDFIATLKNSPFGKPDPSPQTHDRGSQESMQNYSVANISTIQLATGTGENRVSLENHASQSSPSESSTKMTAATEAQNFSSFASEERLPGQIVPQDGFMYKL